MLNILLGCIHVKSWQPPILPPCTSQNWCCAKRLQSLVKCLIIDIQSPGTTGRCRGENQGKFILRLNCNGSTQQQLCWTSTLPSSWQNDCSPTNAAVHSCSDLLQWHLSANVGLYPLRCPTHVNMRLIASPQSEIQIETFKWFHKLWYGILLIVTFGFKWQWQCPGRREWVRWEISARKMKLPNSGSQSCVQIQHLTRRSLFCQNAGHETRDGAGCRNTVRPCYALTSPLSQQETRTEIILVIINCEM